MGGPTRLLCLANKRASTADHIEAPSIVQGGRREIDDRDARRQEEAQAVRGCAGCAVVTSVRADVLAAADNDARWCDAVCRSHGLASSTIWG